MIVLINKDKALNSDDSKKAPRKIRVEGNFLKAIKSWDFPGGPVVKNPPYNAGDVVSIPGQGTRIPRAARQLSPRVTTTELARLN